MGSDTMSRMPATGKVIKGTYMCHMDRDREMATVQIRETQNQICVSFQKNHHIGKSDRSSSTVEHKCMNGAFARLVFE
jgi:hypothetical protein